MADMKPDLMQRRQLMDPPTEHNSNDNYNIDDDESQDSIKSIKYDNKYYLLKEESLLQLPQLQ